MIDVDIGSMIRTIRKRKKITISQLCEGTGLSKGFMSLVENNKTSPSIVTLHTIAKFLDVPLTYLLLEKEERMKVIRKSERLISTHGPDRLVVERASGDTGRLHVVIIDMPPGSASGVEPHAHLGEECHIVLQGTVSAEQGEDCAILYEGDSFSWNASVPHLVRNVGEGTARILIASIKDDDNEPF